MNYYTKTYKKIYNMKISFFLKILLFVVYTSAISTVYASQEKNWLQNKLDSFADNMLKRHTYATHNSPEHYRDSM